MKPTKKPVPYAERLARESVKFGLRVGGSLLRHGPGLLKAGLLGAPLLLLGIGGKSDGTDDENASGISDQGNSAAGVRYDEFGEPDFVAENEADDYNRGLI